MQFFENLQSTDVIKAILVSVFVVWAYFVLRYIANAFYAKRSKKNSSEGQPPKVKKDK